VASRPYHADQINTNTGEIIFERSVALRAAATEQSVSDQHNVCRITLHSDVSSVVYLAST